MKSFNSKGSQETNSAQNYQSNHNQLNPISERSDEQYMKDDSYNIGKKVTIQDDASDGMTR